MCGYSEVIGSIRLLTELTLMLCGPNVADRHNDNVAGIMMMVKTDICFVNQAVRRIQVWA